MCKMGDPENEYFMNKNIALKCQHLQHLNTHWNDEHLPTIWAIQNIIFH